MPISRIASVRGSSPVVSRSRRRCASSALPGARLIVRPALGARGLGRLPRLALGLLQRRVQPVDLGEHLVALRCGWRIAVTKRPWFFSLFSRTRELELLRDLDEGGVLIPESRVVAPFPDQDGLHRGGSGRFDLARQAFPALPEGAVIRDRRRGRWAGEEGRRRCEVRRLLDGGALPRGVALKARCSRSRERPRSSNSRNGSPSNQPARR